MIEVGIIGCGVIGPTHASSIGLDERARVSWACDLNLAKAKERVEAESYTADYRQVLDDPNCQLIAVCTEHPAHPAIVHAALEAGKHVVCEKPLGVFPADVDAMVAAATVAAGKGQVVSGIFQHRYKPLIRRLKQLIDGGDFGAVQEVQMRFACTRTPQYYGADPWRGTWVGEGGGMLINQAIHTLDLVTNFCGTPLSVAGRAERRWLDCIDVDDWAQGTVRYDSGASCTFEAVNCADGGWNMETIVRCELGGFTLGRADRLVAIEHPNAALQAELVSLDQAKNDSVKLPGKACYGSEHAMQYQDVISAISAGRQPLVGFAEAALTNQVVLGLYHSTAIGGGEVALPAQHYQQPVLDKVSVAN